MNQQTLKLLLAGEYICPYRYPDHFSLLSDEAEQEEVNTWLLHINGRLARVGGEGAFFMASDVIGPNETSAVRQELLKVRDTYGPAVQILDFIRQADSGSIYLSPGEYIALYQLESAVAQSTTLENRLKAMFDVINNASNRNTNRTNLMRLMDQLVKDGYAILANKDQGTYQITGKIEQLYAVLQFLDEKKLLPDAEVDDQVADDVTGDLMDQAQTASSAQDDEDKEPAEGEGYQ